MNRMKIDKKLIYKELSKENLDLMIKIQNEVFPEDNAAKDYYDCLYENPSYRKELVYWLVYDGDILVGISGLYSNNVNPDDAWLGWYGVIESQRGKGYGCLMLEYFEKYAKGKGYKTIRLYTHEIACARAIKIYKKFGMISEAYQNKNEDEEISKTILIFSKSLTNDKCKLWNNKYLRLTEDNKELKKFNNYLLKSEE